MGWQATLELDYRAHDGRTTLQHRHSGPLRVFHSLYPEGPGVCHNVLIHPPGGLVEGDDLSIDLRLGDGAHALLSTPGATRFYKSTGPAATQRIRLALQDRARLEWLPLETIAYNGCVARNQIEWALAPGAELIAWDVLALGLPAAGQAFERGVFEQSLHWPGVWREQGRLRADDHRLFNSPLGLAGHRTLGTLVFASGQPLERARRETLLDALRQRIDAHPLALRCGATSPNPQLVLVRALADHVEELMSLWQTLWAALRTGAWGMAHEPPRIWRV